MKLGGLEHGFKLREESRDLCGRFDISVRKGTLEMRLATTSWFLDMIYREMGCALDQ